MPRLTEEDLARLLRNNPDVSTDAPSTPIVKSVIIDKPERVNDHPVRTPSQKTPESCDADVTQRVNAYPPKRNKYGNRKVTVDGITFDSQREYRRYLELREAQASGQIDGLTLQPRFTLMEAWQSADGTKHRRIEYLADFCYRQDGKTVVEDVKSKPTRLNPVYRLKMKLLLYQHRDDAQFVFREVT